MMTQSHFLMTAALRRAMPQARMPAAAVLLGSVAPDIPLTVLSFAGIAYYRGLLGWSLDAAADRMYGSLYFHDPWWISAHSLLHSPVSLGMIALAASWALASRPEWKRFVLWFCAACLFHSLVDIVTHFDDGPVMFWPFNRSYRFSSPVSYWDPNHFGREFVRFELLLTVGLIGYLVFPWLYRVVVTRLGTSEL